jgi:hypothetical protein
MSEELRAAGPLLLGIVPLPSQPGRTGQILAHFAHYSKLAWQSIFLQPDLVQTRGKAKKYSFLSVQC